jgi:hypothetical protein
MNRAITKPTGWMTIERGASLDGGTLVQNFLRANAVLSVAPIQDIRSSTSGPEERDQRFLFRHRAT